MRERVLKVVLGVVGVLFVTVAYPLVLFAQKEPALAMMLSVYVTLGIFLLLSVRNPEANRTLIAFAGWSSVAHASLMAVQAWQHWIQKQELLGVALFVVIGLALILLPPSVKRAEVRTATAGH